MRHVLALTVLGSFVVFSSAAELYAQGRGVGRAQGPKTTTTRGKAPQGPGPKTAAAPRAPKSHPAGPKSTTTRATARANNGKKPTATPPPGTVPPTSTALPTNPRLVERLRTLLPAGTDMTAAAAGFESQGGFVAAVHVADNLRLSFTELKMRIVDQQMSLGQAIQQLRPDIDAIDAARRATAQANDDLAAPRASRRNPHR